MRISLGVVKGEFRYVEIDLAIPMAITIASNSVSDAFNNDHDAFDKRVRILSNFIRKYEQTKMTVIRDAKQPEAAK